MDSPRCLIGSEVDEMDLSLPVMRQMSDVFVRPLFAEQYGASCTHLEGLYFDGQNDVAEIALNAFNKAKGTNFNFEKLNKINVIGGLLDCPTFEAKKEGSDEIFHFRAVVNFALKDQILLCEIKDCKDMGDEMTSYINPNWNYMCFKHERGECYFLDGGGHRSGICDCASRSDN